MERLLSTTEGKLIHYMRTRISIALRKNKNIKHKRTLELLGCNMKNLKQYIENQFNKKPNTIGMSWDNYGEWHIDHIKPCIQYDLSKEKEQKKCFNYKNLQPLWAKDNMKKGSKF